MKASKIAGLLSVFVGLVLVAAQTVREVPWQFGIAIGVAMIVFGGIALVDEENVDPPGDGGEIVPFERR